MHAVITSIEGRKSMLKLAERMVASFCGGVTASAAHQWTTLSGSGAEDVRVMTRKSVDDPGRPPGIVLNAATSFWLPVPPKRVFDFLRDETSRSEVCHSAPDYIGTYTIETKTVRSRN
jgi:homeobox-leucine zipper protein